MEHPLDYFSPQWVNKKPGLLRSRCRACVAEYSADYYQKNKESCDRRTKKNAAKTPEKAVERKRQWRKDNPEKAIAENHYYGVRWHRDNKARKKRIGDYVARKYTGIPCLDCEDIYEWCVMDFDHRPGEIKTFQISARCSYKWTLENVIAVEAEIAVCDLVCSNCHRVRTHILRQHKTHNKEGRNEAQ